MQSFTLSHPITKKELGNPFLIKEINNKHKIKFLNKYVKMLISQISWMIISHHMDNSKIYKHDLIHNFEGSDGDLVTQLNSIFTGQSRDLYIHSHPHLISFDDIAPFHVEYTDRISVNESINTLNRITDGTKELFLDCLIQSDPLRTYILIDCN